MFLYVVCNYTSGMIIKFFFRDLKSKSIPFSFCFCDDNQSEKFPFRFTIFISYRIFPFFTQSSFWDFTSFISFVFPLSSVILCQCSSFIHTLYCPHCITHITSFHHLLYLYPHDFFPSCLCIFFLSVLVFVITLSLSS